MKKFCLFAIAVLMLLVLASCAEPVTPVAYTRFEATGEQFVYYSSVMAMDQIQVYENEAAFKNGDDPVIVLSFTCCHGKDELNDVAYTTVDVSYSPVSLSATVDKKSSSYGSSKAFYLNGTKLDHYDSYDGEYSVLYFYNVTSFVRTNTHGYIDDTKVNVIEYR